ncbi:sensor histidine kinase [Streptomyces sp. NPDC091281]|uniref:sensor histidine kinase n=1 Tax=Streptomyces sp. NPDC091281 TaxID=3365985 RepID=UPI0038020F0A
MLRVASWLIRAVALVLVGIDSLVLTPAGHPGSVPVTVAYGLSAAAFAVWAAADLRRAVADRSAASPAPYRAWPPLPYLLGLITAASALTSAAPHGSAMIGLAIMAVIAAGSETRLRDGWVVAALGVLALQVGALAFGAGRGVFLGFPLLLVVALLAGLNRRAYRLRAEQAARLLAQAEELRAQQRLTAVLDERARLAREIHDVLAQSLGALGIQIQAARALLARGGQEARTDDVLARAQRLAADGLTETRRAVHALRADGPPLPQALETLAENHRHLHRTPVHLTLGTPPPDLSPERNLLLVRITQEALTNAAKHAPGQRVDITLQADADADADADVDADTDTDVDTAADTATATTVTLTVSNPVPAPTLAPAGAPDGARSGPVLSTVDGGYGLTGIRERLLLAGGHLKTGVEDGRWVLTARVPR